MTFQEHLKALLVGGDTGWGPLANTIAGLVREAIIFATLIVGGNIVVNYQSGVPIFTMHFLFTQASLLCYIALQAVWRYLRSQNSVLTGLAAEAVQVQGEKIVAAGSDIPVDPNVPVERPPAH